MGSIFIIDYIFVILYMNIPAVTLASLFYLLRAGRCFLRHNGTDNANETTFSSLYTL